MTKHTPGPWIFTPDDSEAYCAGHVERSGDRYLICQVYTQQNGDRKANARLIAAAPEMLVAMEKALPVLEHWMEYCSDRDDREAILDPFKAAIAKAKPEPNA